MQKKSKPNNVSLESEQWLSGVYHRMHQAFDSHKRGIITYQEMKRLWHEDKEILLRIAQQRGESRQNTQEPCS